VSLSGSELVTYQDHSYLEVKSITRMSFKAP